MKTYVTIINSVLIMIMAALSLFQTACTPISPSLDRRLIVPKKDSVSEPITSSSGSNSTHSIKSEPIVSQALLSTEFDPFSIIEEFEGFEEESLGECTITELDFDTVELFRKNGQLEIELDHPMNTEFAIGVALPTKEAKLLPQKLVDIELTPTGIPHTWVFELASNQDQKLISKVETSVKTIQWRVCNGGTTQKVAKKIKEPLIQKIATKSVGVL